MKRSLISAFLIFVGSTLYSQTHFVGIHGGVNVSRIRSLAGDASKLGPALGINYELRFSRTFSFQAGLMYEQRGGKHELSLFDNSMQEFYTRKYPLVTQHFSLPVTIGLVSKGTTYVSGRMGLIGSYTLNAKLTGPVWQGDRYSDTTVVVSDSFKKLNIILLLEGGVGTAISNRLNLEGLVSLQVGATTTRVTDPVPPFQSNSSEFTIKFPDYPHMAVAVSVGLKYRFGKDEE